MRLKSAINESTLSTAGTVPLPQWGRQRGSGFAAEKGSQPHLAVLGSPFQRKGLAWILPPSYGRRCPEGAEVGWGWRYEKERGDRLKYAINESTLSTAGAVPLPLEGKGDRSGAPHYYLRRSRCHNPEPLKP